MSRARFVLALSALAALSATSTSRAETARFDARWGVEHHRRSWESSRGEHRATQVYMPLDVALRIGPRRLSAGCDLGWSDAEEPAGGGDLSAPREVRAAFEQGFSGDRLRVGLGWRRALRTDGLSESEARLARVLEEVALRWPRSNADGGTRLVLQSTLQVVRRAALLVQAGAGREWQGKHELVADGRRIDPGGRTRVGVGVVAAAGSFREDLALQGEWPGRNRIPGGWGYEPGAQCWLHSYSQVASRVGRLGGSVRALLRAGGSIDPGSPFDPASVRGGNALRVGLDLARGYGAGEYQVELAGVGVRGFSGDLGHAQWVEAGAAWSRPVSSVRVRLSVSLQEGSCREGRALRGTSAALSVSGATR